MELVSWFSKHMPCMLEGLYLIRIANISMCVSHPPLLLLITYHKRHKTCACRLQVWCNLAEKLGWNGIKSEMEDLCFAVLEYEDYSALRCAQRRSGTVGHGITGTLFAAGCLDAGDIRSVSTRVFCFAILHKPLYT